MTIKVVIALLLASFSLACGIDKELVMDTKFDAPLRQKMSELASRDEQAMLAVLGKCAVTIDAHMRQELIDAGAEVETMTGDIFTARVSSEDIYNVAALEFVVQLQLSQTSKILPK